MAKQSHYLPVVYELPALVSMTPVAMAIPKMMKGSKIPARPMIAKGSCTMHGTCR